MSKVLIISHNSFSRIHNNGKTLESIFSSFKKDNLAQLFFCSNEIPDFEFCNNYYKITDLDILKTAIHISSKCGEKLQYNHKIDNVYFKKNKFIRLIENGLRIKIDLLTIFRDYLWKSNTWKNPNLEKWVNQFDPDIIFYVGGNFGFSHEISTYFSKHLNIPLAVYFTDDYLINPIPKNIIDRIQKIRIKKFYRKTIEQSSLRFAIGTKMTNDYSKYFGMRFFPVMNSVKINPFIKKEENDNTSIIISYVGGLHLNRWQMIIDFAKVVNALKNSTNTQININVYSSMPNKNVIRKFKENGIDYMGFIQGNKIDQVLQHSDILLHVESDNKHVKSLTKLSVSTKIPEYLISNSCIIGYGPNDVASMQLLSENKIGIVISSNASFEENKSTLYNIITNKSIRNRYAYNGYEFAKTNFDGEKIRLEFTTLIEECIKQTK